MFQEFINETPLCNIEADEYFCERIYYHNDRTPDDATLISTLRALIGDRLPEDESYKLDFSATNMRARDITSDPCETIRRIVRMDYESEYNTLGFHLIRNKNAEDWMSILRNNFQSTYEGYVLVEKVTEAFKKYFNVLCFINPEKRCARLFMDDGSNVRWFHYIQYGMPAFLPWFFTDGNLSEDERALLMSLRERSPQKYMALLEKFAAKYNFRELKIRRLLDGFESIFEQEEKARLEDRVREIMDRVGGYSETISDLLREKRDLDTRLLGYSLRVDGAGEEPALMNYFLTNKALTLISMDRQRLRFVASGRLLFFDEDLVERVLENKNSFVYKLNSRSMDSVIPADDMKMLMKSIFIDQNLWIRSCAAYDIIVGGGVQAIAHYNYGLSFNNCLPNQHIDQFRCLGNHEPLIRQCVMNNDYIGAVAQCIASSQSLNFGDGVVMGQFMSRMYDREAKPFIVLPDGTSATPRQAIKYLKDSQVKEGESE